MVYFFGSFVFMEFAAWFMHKYVMHGFLWTLHKDHHSMHQNTLERNDIFALIFAVPSFILIWLGSQHHWNYLFGLGLGIAGYGICYFIFHDMLYHRRIQLFNQNANRYFRILVKAHGDHHAGKKNYGFLFMFPWKYFRQVK